MRGEVGVGHRNLYIDCLQTFKPYLELLNVVSLRILWLSVIAAADVVSSAEHSTTQHLPPCSPAAALDLNPKY